MILRVYKQSIRILFFCLCLFHSGLSHAQQYKLTRQFGFKDGLLSYAIGQMLVDSNGMMWLNNDGNLFVYDGKQFELISSKNGQDRERISTDLLNINGSIYFIDRHGAYLVYPEEFRIGGSDTAILNEYRQSKREALALETLFKGILLELGTTDNLKTFRRTLDDQQVQMLVHYSKMQSTNTGESDYHISSIQHGDSMVIVMDTFIFMLNDHQLKVAEISSDVPEEWNGAYFQGKVGNHIYLMNVNGLFRLGFTNGQLQMVPVMNEIEYNDNYSYCIASLNNDETIFLGTVYRGLLRFDKVKLRVYDNLERIVYHENSSLKQYSATKYTYALKRKSLQAELSTNSIWLINGDIHANNGMYWDAETGALKGASPFFFPLTTLII